MTRIGGNWVYTLPKEEPDKGGMAMQFTLNDGFFKAMKVLGEISEIVHSLNDKIVEAEAGNYVDIHDSFLNCRIVMETDEDEVKFHLVLKTERQIGNQIKNG